MTTEYTDIMLPVDDDFAASCELFKTLVSKLRSPETAQLDHAEVEALIGTDSQKIMCSLLQDHLDLRAAREEKREAVAGADGVDRSHRRPDEPRGLRSVFGDVTVTRISYEARGSGALKPLDAELNLPPGLYSHGVTRRIVEDAIKMSFDGAVSDLQRTAGVHVPKRQAEELVRGAAADFAAFYAGRAARGPQATDDLLVLSTDGKGVVVRRADLREATRRKAEREAGKRRKRRLAPGEKRNRKRMGTVAAVYSVPRHVRTPEEVLGTAELPEGVTPLEKRRPRPTDKRVWASLARGPDAVMDDVFLEALRRDPKTRRRWVFLVDGDLDQLARVRDFAELHDVRVEVICDFVHVLEYLWTAAHCFHPAGCDEAEEWVVARALEVLRGKSSDVAAGMRRSATLRGLDQPKRKGVDDCARYLVNHRGHLRYDVYLAAGYPIASGVIEGACRHLVNDRLGITGARWSLAGAEAVLRLRSLWASGDLDEYFAFHRRRELQRNHLSRYAKSPLRRAS
jgi:hypothetical protein